ncbi:hypothetical protein V6A89_001571 [Enterobacter hormaechei]
MNDHSSNLDKILSILVILAVEHWIIASLVIGLVMYLIASAINENAQTNFGAITSGVVGVCGQLIFGFGVLASIIGVVKFIWIHA